MIATDPNNVTVAGNFKLNFIPFWLDVDFPEGMEINLQLAIFAKSYQLFAHQEERLRSLDLKLEDFLERAPIADHGWLSVLYFVPSLKNAIEVANLLRGSIDSKDPLVSRMLGGEMLAQLVSKINSNEDVLRWARFVSSWPVRKSKRNGESYDIQTAGIVAFSYLNYTSPNYKPELLREELISLLEEVSESSPEIAALALREVIVILVEQEKKYELVIGIASRFYEKLTTHGQGIVDERIGVYSRWNKRYELAEARLLSAINGIGLSSPSLHHSAIQQLSVPKSETLQHESAIDYAEKACEFAKLKDLSELDYVRSLGELALAQFFAGHLAETLNAFEAAIELLRIADRNSNVVKEIIVIAAHCAGYFASMSRHGKPPKMEDGEYLPPPPGFFFTSSPERLALYSEKMMAYVFANMVNMAETLGWDDVAAEWAERSKEESVSTGSHMTGILMEFQASFKKLKAFEWESVLSGAYESGTSLVLYARIHASTKAGMQNFTFSQADVLSQSELIQVDSYVVHYGLLPILLGVIAIEDKEIRKQNLYVIANLLIDYSLKSAQPLRFVKAASIVKEVADQTLQWKGLVQIGNEQHKDVAIWLCAYILALTDPGIELNGALEIQDAILNALQQISMIDERMTGRMLESALDSFWRVRVRDSKYRFNFPRQLNYLSESNLSGAAYVLEVLPALKQSPTSALRDFLVKRLEKSAGKQHKSRRLYSVNSN